MGNLVSAQAHERSACFFLNAQFRLCFFLKKQPKLCVFLFKQAKLCVNAKEVQLSKESISDSFAERLGLLCREKVFVFLLSEPPSFEKDTPPTSHKA